MPGASLPAVEVRTLATVSPRNPILVCGLPGSGFVGKLAADYLVATFKAQRIAEFFANSFPPHVNITDEGVGVRLKGELFLAETGQASDILVFTADAQPTTSSGEYELADAVLNEAQKLKTKSVFSLAAYMTGTFAKERKVHGTATSTELLPKLTACGVEVMREGGITGMNGVVIGMAKLRGMEGFSLLGETAGYLLDPAASYAVLETLSKILGVKIDLASIEERAKEAQQVFGQVQRMAEQEVEEAGTPRDERRPGYIA